MPTAVPQWASVSPPCCAVCPPTPLCSAMDQSRGRVFAMDTRKSGRVESVLEAEGGPSWGPQGAQVPWGPKADASIFKYRCLFWTNLSEFNNSFLLRIIHVKVITPGCLQSWRSQANKMKGKGGNTEKVPVLVRGIQREGRVSSTAPRDRQAFGDLLWEEMPRQHPPSSPRLQLLLPQSSSKKCKSQGFLPKFSVSSQDPGASGRALEGSSIQVPWPTAARYQPQVGGKRD